jgi:hypothetical protein
MPWFNRNKTAKKSDPTPQPVAAPTKDEVEAEMRDLLSNQAKISNMIGKPIKTSNSPSDDELLRELAELERQYGSSRGGDRVAALRGMIRKNIDLIKQYDKYPATPQSAEARKRLLELAKNLNEELKRLTNKGARRTKRKKSTRRRRVRRSS